MTKVDYAFYIGVFLGDSIPEREFSGIGQRACYELERFKRMYTVTSANDDAEKMAICAMADALYMIQMAQNGTSTVSSASIGSVSVNYGSPQALDLSHKGQSRELYRAACTYLDIYRG